MAESQKLAAPSVKSKEKSSLLEIDIDKDFLGSWKSMPAADDGMDFDFGPATGGKKKPSKFDKMDMDFSFDADFGKLPSFEMDMPGFDISSPAKKSEKSKERSKEASTGGEHRAKRDSFQFSFNFDEFSDLGFDSKKTKVDEKSNKSTDEEGFSNASDSGGFGDLFGKKVDASEDDDISSKLPASRFFAISEVDTQMDNIEPPDLRNEENNLESVMDESSLLKPANAEEQEIQRASSPEPQDPIQESQSPEKRSSPEPHAQQVAQDVYGHSSADNVSTEDTVSEVQEEESRSMVRMVSPRTGGDQNDNLRPVAESIPARSLSLETLSANMDSQSQKGEMCERRDDNVDTGHNDVDNTSKAGSHLENSTTPRIESLAHEGMVDKRNADSFSKLHVDSLDGGTNNDELVSQKERSVPVRSKYFKRQDGSESELQQASVSSTKLVSIGNKRLSTLSNNAAPEKREFGSRIGESGSKFTGIPKPLPKVLTRDIPVQTENTERGHAKGPDNTRECLNADNIKRRNEPQVTTVAHDTGPTKEESVPRGSDQNAEHLNAHRSDDRPSSLIEQSKKNLTLISLNPGLHATNMASVSNMKKIAVDKNRTSSSKAELKTYEVSTLKVSRLTEPKLKPLSSLLPKNLTSMRNKDQCVELQGNMVFKNPSVDTKKQTPSTPTLKRKAPEESTEITRLVPLKRLSASPSNSIRASSPKVVEAQVDNYASVAPDKSPRFDISQLEMDVSSSMDDGSIFEKAEACSKELEDICNMLKKKHEEAKDILVRAIVNNNNLLMLNHPIYQDKISMVQKFAALLISK